MKDKKITSIADLKKTDWIIYETVVGSHAYGTNTPESDVDTRGVFVYPESIYASLDEPEPQISDAKHDIVYYSLKKLFELLKNSNPNMIELLWMPEKGMTVKSKAMQKIIDNRNLFISKQAFHTHSGYAYAQIKKAKGQNKKVHNPCPKEQPKKEDFCWIIEYFEGKDSGMGFNGQTIYDDEVFPCRPVLLNEANINLEEYHASSLEHSHNIFRLYYYGEEAKGVFRGKDMLVCESIPKDDEIERFKCLLIYNKDMYEKALKEHRSYWAWKNNRNEARWVDQEKGKLNYDQKNMMHCMRLLLSGENILKNGEPIVRFEGKDLEYLMSIRNGEMSYEQLMKDVDEKMKVLEDLYKNSTAIPEEVDVDKIKKLYEDIRKNRFGE